MPKVYLASCEDYEYVNVKHAVMRGIEALGGIDKLIGSGKNVAVKPNLIMAKKPEDCVTTHPTVMQAVLEAVIEGGNSAKIVESPAGAFTKGNISNAYDVTQMTVAASNSGAQLNFDFDVEEAQLPLGQSVNKIRIAKAIAEADCVISAGKLKTHSMMTYTGATKNLYGVVPGLTKVEGHYRLPDPHKFAGMIVDIAQYVDPPLSIIDAVWGMEGEGPTAGNPRKIGVIIVSDSPFAADFIAGRIINLPAEENPVINKAIQRGLCIEKDIELLGDDLSEFYIEDFEKPPVYTTSILTGKVPKFLEPTVEKWMKLYPKFDAALCISCGICVRSCPAKALEIKDKLPQLEKKKCISCFCCHEMCPEKAVGIKRPLILKTATKLFK
jgi:uncharacterized protein (DUF362 family)/Pyruvate/2-oxoacid:ferredoxin oxidoreductase delta subunit